MSSELQAHSLSRAASKRAIYVGLGISTTFLVVEAVGGWLTNSLALLSDAGHLLTDVGALGLALLAFRFAARPASLSRTYGHYRAEILAASANGLTLWLVAAYILYEAYRRFLNPPEVHSGPMLAVAVAGFFANVVVAVVLRRASRESLNVRSAFMHVATDAVQSIGVIIAGLLMLYFGWYIADPIISVVIALLIAYTGTRVILQAVSILMEGVPSAVDVGALRDAICEAPGVDSVHDLHLWSITSGYYPMSVHVTLKSNAGAEERRGLLERLQGMITRDYGISHVTIQVEDGAMECNQEGARQPYRSSDCG